MRYICLQFVSVGLPENILLVSVGMPQNTVSGYATEYIGYATEYSGYATEYSQWVCHRILLASRADKMQVCIERVCLLKVGPYV